MTDTSDANLSETSTIKDETLEELENHETIGGGGGDDDCEKSCDKCKSLVAELDSVREEKKKLNDNLTKLQSKFDSLKGELEREVQRRCDLEQRFTEEAKRSTDQIEELIKKSDLDDAKLNDLKKRFELYSRETSSMIENFTTNREILTSQLLELRQENDYLLGKFIGKSRDLQNGEINLPQTVDELQFHCLTLNEKLILATMAKEQLEETLMMQTTSTQAPANPLQGVVPPSTIPGQSNIIYRQL